MKNILLLSLLLLPFTASAHGSIQKVVEGKYLLNLSSAPLAPQVGQEQQNVLAISDVKTNSLVQKNILFSVTIQKEGKQFYAAQNLVATGGLLPLKYTFPEPGIYELFADFSLPGDPYLYEPEDIWIQVVPAQTAQGRPLVWIVVAAVVGFLIGKQRSRKV